MPPLCSGPLEGANFERVAVFSIYTPSITSASAVAYNQAQAKWDKASQELNTVLATISKTVSQGNDAMSDVNRRAAASWG